MITHEEFDRLLEPSGTVQPDEPDPDPTPTPTKDDVPKRGEED